MIGRAQFMNRGHQRSGVVRRRELRNAMPKIEHMAGTGTERRYR